MKEKSCFRVLLSVFLQMHSKVRGYLLANTVFPSKFDVSSANGRFKLQFAFLQFTYWSTLSSWVNSLYQAEIVNVSQSISQVSTLRKVKACMVKKLPFLE